MKMSLPKMGGDVEITININCGQQDVEEPELEDSPLMYKAPQSISWWRVAVPVERWFTRLRSSTCAGIA